MNILTYPHPVLRLLAEPVKNIDQEIQDLIHNMIEALHRTPSGVGLAANQVGVTKRIIVYDFHREEGDGRAGALINPEIVMSEGKITREEACLSIIDFSAEVTRKAQVKVRGVDQNEKPVDIEAEDLMAICFQHEIDHLNGILFIDHISSLKRALYKKRLKKRLRAK
jgi:peptide deformylase